MADSGEPMSIARVRGGFEAWSRGDWKYVQAWLAPDALWEENNSGGFPGLDPVYVGPEGFAKWMADTREAWDAIESIAEVVTEVPSATGPAFVVEARLAARGRQDIEVDWVLFNVLWTRDAQEIVRRRIYFDRDEAFAAAAQDSNSFDAVETPADTVG